MSSLPSIIPGTGSATRTIGEPAETARAAPWQFDLEVLLQASAPDLAFYRALATEAGGSSHLDQDYFRPMMRSLAQLRLPLRAFLAGTLITDLGAGPAAGAHATELAERFACGEHVGLDVYASDEPGIREHDRDQAVCARLPARLRRVGALRGCRDTRVRTHEIQGDILEYVARFPSASGSFMLNGLDGQVIRSRLYHRALAAELVRATAHGGLVFGCHSLALAALRGHPELKLLGQHCVTFVFQRR